MSKFPPEDFFEGKSLEFAKAIKHGDIEKIRLMSKGIDLNAQASKGMTFIWFAIQERQFAAISELVRLGVNPDYAIAEGIGSAVTYSIYNSDTLFLRALLDGGFSSNWLRGGQTPLLYRAALNGSVAHVTLLLERKADPNLPNSIGETALFPALSTLKFDVIDELFAKGANPGVVTKNGVSFAWAVEIEIPSQQPNSETWNKLQALKKKLEGMGIKFPADPPQVVREKLKLQGK